MNIVESISDSLSSIATSLNMSHRGKGRSRHVLDSDDEQEGPTHGATPPQFAPLKIPLDSTQVNLENILNDPNRVVMKPAPSQPPAISNQQLQMEIKALGNKIGRMEDVLVSIVRKLDELMQSNRTFISSGHTGALMEHGSMGSRKVPTN